MRTVSFSKASVNRMLNDDFFCVHLNSQGERSSGASFAHPPSDPAGPCIRGNGSQNVQILFLTPSGKIFHVISGFIGPADLEEELEFVRKTYQRWKEPPGSSRETLIAAHAERLRALKYTEDEIAGRAGGVPGLTLRSVTAMAVAIGEDPQRAVDELNKAASRFQTLHDYRFAMQHTLLPIKKFRPEILVGSGKSFFGSTANGRPGGYIGVR